MHKRYTTNLRTMIDQAQENEAQEEFKEVCDDFLLKQGGTIPKPVFDLSEKMSQPVIQTKFLSQSINLKLPQCCYIISDSEIQQAIGSDGEIGKESVKAEWDCDEDYMDELMKKIVFYPPSD